MSCELSKAFNVYETALFSKDLGREALHLALTKNGNCKTDVSAALDLYDLLHVVAASEERFYEELQLIVRIDEARNRMERRKKVIRNVQLDP